MMQYIDNVLAKRSLFIINMWSTLLVALLGVLDYVTGFEMSFSIFYILPIALSSWYTTKNMGFLMAFFSTGVWLLVDFTSHSYTREWILFWNAVVRMAFFYLIAYLIIELKERLKNEEMMARTDLLTKVCNQSFFKEKVHKEIKLSARYHDSMVIGYIDLDNFKAVNDNMGHSAGDKVLKTVALLLSSSCRETDIVGRMGGDEFAIFLPRTNESGAKVFFNDLYHTLISHVKSTDWGIGFSIGVAIFVVPPSDVDTLLMKADQLMYEVKKNGKNSIAYGVYR